ncbi:MAG: hypothetical protein J3K34DRAFT_518158 [Monoraphidium minutum]|nr:MAG: hypothetical protein J3K34DRAFT_518158 [Monoraphidium minutum]
MRQFGGPLLTFAVLAAALGVSFARRRDERRRRAAQQLGGAAGAHEGALAAAGTGGGSSRYFAEISGEALKLLVATSPLPHAVIDVRGGEPQQQPLPPELAPAAVAVPDSKVAAALTQRGAWAAAAAAACAAAAGGGAPRLAAPGAAAAAAGPPSLWHLLVFVDDADGGAARRAAGVAAALGFDRTAVVSGGLEGYLRSGGGGGEAAGAIGRDALAALLGRLPLPPPQPPPPGPPPPDAYGGGAGGGGSDDEGGGGGGGDAWAWQLERAVVLDVRRCDERTLYGAIPGAAHIPADELASALALGPADFGRRYRIERPGGGAPLVLHSRTAGRAQWAAQVAADAGYSRLLVLRGGAYSWRSDGVKPYSSYQPWQPPPDPEPLPPEPLDAAAALDELMRLGLAAAGPAGRRPDAAAA